MIRKFIKEKREHWDSFLDTLAFAYKKFCHKSTLHIPFEVVFWRKAILPIDHDTEMPITVQLLKKLEDDTDGHEKATEISHLIGATCFRNEGKHS